MKISKIKALKTEELKKEYSEKQAKYKQYQLDLKSAKEKDFAKAKFLRRDIARILTLLNQRDLEPMEVEVEITGDKTVKK